ncbi:hypothetical protein D6850_10395 [Roseovarius spongiae]|uniref:Aminoglycoside phosphotransferase domain-containing protein n=1 Tax=Roseovarius spongiae TaxID=2320272 RepID=A0A3A8B9X8_9RHOB|nr:phosphotransferase [Roseovarius spongiae]RKF15235.1 hypothetical protein D6850_10395 [Roseovarius spongiae]
MTDLETSLIIARKLEAAGAHDPSLAMLEPLEIIRHVPAKRVIFRAMFRETRAVVRLSLRPDGGATAAEWDEMQRLWPHMAEGRFRIARPLHACPGHGVIIVEDVRGVPLLEHLRSLAPPARPPWLHAAADWLRASTAMSESWRPAAPEGWLRRAESAAEQQPFAQIAAHEAGILAEMQRLAARMDATQWRVAITHGDFHPNNLIAEGDRLTGIDTGGSHRLPIYKDMARFLMHLGRRRINLGGPRRFGVSRAGLDAFAAAFALAPVERELFLPFMLGFEALIRVESSVLPQSRIVRAEKMAQELLEDLRAL